MSSCRLDLSVTMSSFMAASLLNALFKSSPLNWRGSEISYHLFRMVAKSSADHHLCRKRGIVHACFRRHFIAQDLSLTITKRASCGSNMMKSRFLAFSFQELTFVCEKRHCSARHEQSVFCVSTCSYKTRRFLRASEGVVRLARNDNLFLTRRCSHMTCLLSLHNFYLLGFVDEKNPLAGPT